MPSGKYPRTLEHNLALSKAMKIAWSKREGQERKHTDATKKKISETINKINEENSF